MLKKSAAFVLVTILLFAAVAATAQEASGPTVLVIPPRYTIVKLGMDMAALRPVILISCQGTDTEPVMHVWNDDPGEWIPLSVAAFRSGEMFRAQPRDIIVVGADQDMPGSVVDAAHALATVKRVNTLELVSVINTLNESLGFDRGEWRWLAERYDLQLKDVNAERRRYGKYGPRGGPKVEVLVPRSEEEPEVLSPPIEEVASPTVDSMNMEPPEPRKGADMLSPAPESMSEVAPEDK